MQAYKIRVVIADDHPAIVEGIRHSIAVNTIELADTARNSTEIIKLLDKGIADVLVTDYAMPGGEFGDGLPLFEFILRRYPDIKIVVMTMMNNPGVLRTLIALGVRCILSKSDDASHLIPAIHIASAGGQYFSPEVNSIVQTLGPITPANNNGGNLSKRESEVVRLYVFGMKIDEIAEQLHRSKQTVSSQKNSAMKKIGVARDADLFKYALEAGWVPSSFVPSSL
jgi:two-component system, NarL family, captular synthesis response regulator RcsB